MATNERLVRTQNYVNRTIRVLSAYTARHARFGAMTASVVGLTLAATGLAVQNNAASPDTYSETPKDTIKAAAQEASPAQSQASSSAASTVESNQGSTVHTNASSGSSIHVETHTDENGTQTEVVVDGEPIDLPDNGNGSVHATIPTDNGTANVRVTERNTQYEGRNYTRSSNSLNVSSTSRSDDGSSRSTTSTSTSSSSYSYQRGN